MIGRHLLIGLLGLTATYSVANAATETYDFLGSYPGVYDSSMDFTSTNGNIVTVTSGTYDHTISGGSSGGLVGQWTGAGLGMCSSSYLSSCYEAHFVDGYRTAEFLQFSFDYDVTIESIQFADYGNDMFDLTLADGTDLWDMSYDLTGLFSATIEAGTSFFVGAYGAMGFKVQSLTVSYDSPSEVPLPAAGWLLIAGMGGLAALKRRSRA